MKVRTLASGILLSLALSAGSAVAAGAASDEAPNNSGDQVTFGGNVIIPQGETREGDVVAFGGSIQVDGTVTRDVVSLGGSVVINGHVGRDVASVGGSVTLGPHAVVGRNIALAGGSLNKAPGAQVGGSVAYGQNGNFGGFGSAVRGARHINPFHGFDFIFGLVTAIGIIILALLILVLFPRQLQTASAVLVARPAESFGLGCAGVIAGVILAGLLILTILLPLVIASALTVGWLFGWAAIFLLVGQRLLQSINRPQELVPALLLGGVLIGILANIPVLGFFVVILGGSFALGAAILSRLGTQGPGTPLLPTVASSPPPSTPSPG